MRFFKKQKKDMRRADLPRQYNKKDENPRLTKFLMIVCFLVYIGELVYGQLYGDKLLKIFFEEYGFSAASFFAGNYWNIITSIFLHAGPDHLFLNLLALYFFGRAVELELGWRKCLLIFFITGIAGNIAVLSAGAIGLMPMDIPTIGASAAIFGLMGAAMFVKPFDLVFYPYLLPVPLILVAVLYTLYNIGAFAASLVTGMETDIAYIAHLGGLIAGAYFGLKQEGIKRRMLVIFLIFIILLAIPFFISVLQYLEAFNYIPLLSQLFV